MAQNLKKNIWKVEIVDFNKKKFINKHKGRIE